MGVRDIVINILISLASMFLGWALSILSVYIHDFRNKRDKHINTIHALQNVFIETANKASAFFSMENPIGICVTNPWWAHNKLAVFQDTPQEAVVFDKWIRFAEDVPSMEKDVKSFKELISITAETKNSLEMSLRLWQQPWHKVLWLHLRNKL